MNLPFQPPLAPMLAKLTPKIPSAPGSEQYLFEPKWDGFRCMVFRDEDEIFLQSRDLKPLGRYFPELEQHLLEHLPPRCVVDGEIILLRDGRLDFSSLQLRLHPAESRILRLSKELPSSYVAFDLLALGDEDLREQGQLDRRRALEESICESSALHLTPATRDPQQAQLWFDQLEGGGIEGVIAKEVDLRYQPKKRVMLKIKHTRTVDCVVGGFRWHKNEPGKAVGSLLLGLYDAEGKLHHLGITSSFKMTVRRELADELRPHILASLEGHPWNWGGSDDGKAAAHIRTPRGGSRWSRGKSLSFEALPPERVVEVRYDYLHDGRFRHATTFLRWRQDKPAEECTLDQIDVPESVDLTEALFSS